MQRVINLLRKHSESVPVALELPTEDEVVQVEEQILLPLNPELRLFLLEVSDIVYGKVEPVTATDHNSHTYLPTVAAQAWAEGVPRDLIPICQEAQHYYCMDATGEITLWHGETQDTNVPAWDSIWDWVEDVWLDNT